MKIVSNLQQGSADWLQYRAARFGSSEAAAMLGLSSYTTRSELLRMKHTGLAQEFGDWFQRHVLDKGHAVEAATRPMIEQRIGDALYPVVCQGEGRLVASVDGMDLEGALVWECKQWAELLASRVEHGSVPDSHMPQCQQILMVTGAQRLLFTVSNGADQIVTTEVLPSPEWFQRLRDGWSQFEKDLAAYTLPDTAEPAPVGKAPDTLPALLIQVTGAVTASNLAEFKATALGAIRAVNRDLRTDADFADAEKAVRWCADVESRIKAAKEHAQAQASDIDALFRALDDITAECRTVRLDLAKLADRRKQEVKEHAVDAARKALDLHIAALQAELAPMRLQPPSADFVNSIRGLRSIASMQDALDTTLAGAKIAADGQARLVRGNVAHFKLVAAGSEFLFPDLGLMIGKAPDDFVAVLAARMAKHEADEARRAAERQAAEAQRIAAAEKWAREQEAQRLADRLAESDRPEALAVANRERAAAAAAETLHAPAQPAVAMIVPPPAAPPWTATMAAPAAHEPATLKLGTICERLGFNVSAAFMGDVLHIRAAETSGRAVLYRESQWPVIIQQLQAHIGAMGELYALSLAA